MLAIIDITILEGHRSRKNQTMFFTKGVSKVEWPDSKHNVWPSEAVDAAPAPIDWEDYARFYFLAGVVKAVAAAHNVKVRWGGDWDGDTDFNDQSFNDLVHFEFIF